MNTQHISNFNQYSMLTHLLSINCEVTLYRTPLNTVSYQIRERGMPKYGFRKLLNEDIEAILFMQ